MTAFLKKNHFKTTYIYVSKVNDSENVLLSSYWTRNKCMKKLTVAVKEHFLDLAFHCLEE